MLYHHILYIQVLWIQAAFRDIHWYIIHGQVEHPFRRQKNKVDHPYWNKFSVYTMYKHVDQLM